MAISLGSRLLDPSSSLPGSRWRAGPTRGNEPTSVLAGRSTAPCSTLLVKQPVRSIKNLLVPIDVQEDADAVLSFFKKNPFREACSITVLHVIPMVDPVWPVGAMVPAEFRNEMRSYAEKFTQVLCLEFERLGHQAKGLAIEGAPSVTIVEEIRKTKPDILVMRPQSQSGVSRFFLGSVSHSVVHNTDCSILLVRE